MPPTASTTLLYRWGRISGPRPRSIRSFCCWKGDRTLHSSMQSPTFRWSTGCWARSTGNASQLYHPNNSYTCTFPVWTTSSGPESLSRRTWSSSTKNSPIPPRRTRSPTATRSWRSRQCSSEYTSVLYSVEWAGLESPTNQTRHVVTANQSNASRDRASLSNINLARIVNWDVLTAWGLIEMNSWARWGSMVTFNFESV